MSVKFIFIDQNMEISASLFLWHRIWAEIGGFRSGDVWNRNGGFVGYTKHKELISGVHVPHLGVIDASKKAHAISGANIQSPRKVDVVFRMAAVDRPGYQKLVFPQQNSTSEWNISGAVFPVPLSRFIRQGVPTSTCVSLTEIQQDLLQRITQYSSPISFLDVVNFERGRGFNHEI